MDTDLSELIAVMEEVIEMTGANRKFNPERREFTPKVENPKERETKSVENPPKRNLILECHNCGEKGHKKYECPNPKKRINNIKVDPDSDGETHSDFDIFVTEPEGSQYGRDNNSDLEGSHRCLVIQADIGDNLEVNVIYGESNLPQKWNSTMEIGHVSDAKLLTNKPASGMSYTMGKTSYTTVLYKNKELKALLDIGAFCSCTSSDFLDTCFPEWRERLLPVPKAKFSSCNSSMEPLGVVTMPLIFPHSKGSLRLNVEFVVLLDAVCEYLELGNDTFCMYGIDIFQSKNRF